MRKGRLGCWLLLLLLAIVGGITLWGAIRVGPVLADLYRSARELYALREEITGWPTAAERARVRRALKHIDRDVTDLVAFSRPLYPALRYAAPVPYLGPTVASIPNLLEAGSHATHALYLLTEVVLPALPEQPPDAMMDLVPPLLQRISQEDARLAEAQDQLDAAHASLSAVEAARLPSPLDAWLSRAQAWSAMGGDGIALMRLAPDVLGVSGPRTWLILALNNEELRPTGGFISAVGTLQVANGAIESITFEDSYAFYSREHRYSLAPPAMRTMLEAPILLLRDANWWPDGPTSARMVAKLYELERGTRVDGVVSLDLRAVQLVVDGLGGVRVGPKRTYLTGDTILPYLYKAWANPTSPEGESQVYEEGWWKERKRFVDDLKNAILTRVFQQPGAIPWTHLVRKTWQALHERHITIVALTNAHSRRIIAQRGWDAALRPGKGDYLRVTDTNVGFNKANAKVIRRVEYTVDLRSDAPESTLVITYQHTSRAPVVRCLHLAYYGTTYEEMQDRCYWNFLRVARPRDTTILDVTGLQTDTIRIGFGDAGTREVAGLMTLLPGQTHTVTIRSTVPRRPDGDVYTLRVQKQPGTANTPITLHIMTARGTRSLAFSLDTDVDIRFDLRRQTFTIRPTYPLKPGSP